MLIVQTGTDFGCEMTAADIDSYVELVERRLGDIYGVDAELRGDGVGNTRCVAYPDGIDPDEVRTIVGVDLWAEWCAEHAA